METKKTINYYEILNINYDADRNTVKSAFRKLARHYHPDVNPNNTQAAEKFKEIAEAYEILSNSEKRAKYDRLNNFWQPEQKINEENTTKAREKESSLYRKTYKVPNEPKNVFGDIFNDILESFKNSGKKRNYRKAVNGTNIYANVKISQQEAIEGTVRTVNILHTSICHNCFGKKFINDVKCPLCQGKGETSIQKKLNVKIPAFIHDGAKIRIANEGNQGQYGGSNGDLYLTVIIEKTSKFVYEGNNAFIELPITPYEAALGANVNIDTPNGCVTIKIPTGTNSGQKFRLNGQGVNHSGDLVVTIKICVPKELSPEEKKLYEKLKEISSSKIR